MQAIRYEAEVTDDHFIHIETPNLPGGTIVELIALIKESAPKQAAPIERMDWTKKMGQYPRFDSLDQVNQYVRSLREDRDDL